MGDRVLITGVQEFVGRYLAADWLAADPDALLLGLDAQPRSDASFPYRVTWGESTVPAPVPADLRCALATPRYRIETLDFLDVPMLVRRIREFRPTLVVHLYSAFRDDRPDRLFRRNVESTIALIEAIAGAGIDSPRLLLGSSGGVYGAQSARSLPLRETTRCRPVDLYSVSKRTSEQVARILCARHRIRSIWARIFNVTGPAGEERHFCEHVAAQAASIAASARAPILEVGNLESTRDFVDVRDVARALRLLALRGAAGERYNIARGEEVPIRFVLEECVRIAGIRDRIALRTHPERPIDIPRHYASVEKIRRLGFRPRIDLRQTLSDILDYYGSQVRPRACGQRRIEPDHGGCLRVVVPALHSYEVTIDPNSFAGLPRRLAVMFPESRMILLTDERVERLYTSMLRGDMESIGLRVSLVAIPEGEASKSTEVYRGLIRRLRREEFDRRAVLVNVGGGMVTDLGGFVAATYMRGVAYVNVPTTLLAQHDAAVGGKVAINTPWAKNFVGAFHHPHAVFVDPCLLATLSDRDMASGIAEAVKVAVTGDPDLFALLECEVDAIRRLREPEVLATLIRRAAARKIDLLSADPYETDLRRKLNLGHTFGHSLETELGYGSIRHGEAVACGVAVATEVARARGACDDASADRIRRLLARYDLPPRLPQARLRAACERLREIRLVRGCKLNFVLPTGVASVEIVDEIEPAEIEAAIEAVCSSMQSVRCSKERRP